MDLIDVNILISAFRSDAPYHLKIKHWLEKTLSSGKPLILIPIVEVGFLGIVTHSKIFQPASSFFEASSFLSMLAAVPSVEMTSWTFSTRKRWLALCEHLALCGNDVNDAMLAAIALEKGYRLVTMDNGFSRFPYLTCWNPISDVVKRR